MFQAVVAALFMNIYIVGLNQLSDVEIDKVWKLLIEICIANKLFFFQCYSGFSIVPVKNIYKW